MSPGPGRARRLGGMGKRKAILDAGCGEGYYSAQIARALPRAALYGLDISKDAVRLAAGRYKSGTWICGTAAHLPFPSGSLDLILSMFALTVPEEFHRVLTPGGVYLQVLAAEDHLLGLKKIIYPSFCAGRRMSRTFRLCSGGTSPDLLFLYGRGAANSESLGNDPTFLAHHPGRRTAPGCPELPHRPGLRSSLCIPPSVDADLHRALWAASSCET